LIEFQWIKEELRSKMATMHVNKKSIDDDSVKEMITKENDLARAFRRLYQRFNQVSIEGAKVIISEHSAGIPREHRRYLQNTISDGEKGSQRSFHYEGIVFKLAVDDEGRYGSDEYAMKAPLHERKSFVAISRMSELLWKSWSIVGEDSPQYIKKQGTFIT